MWLRTIILHKFPRQCMQCRGIRNKLKVNISSEHCSANYRSRFASCPWRQSCLRQQTEDLAPWHSLTASQCPLTAAGGDAVLEVRSSSTTPYRTTAVPRLTSSTTNNSQPLRIEQSSYLSFEVWFWPNDPHRKMAKPLEKSSSEDLRLPPLPRNRPSMRRRRRLQDLIWNNYWLISKLLVLKWD